MQICLWWLFSQVPASWVRFGIPRKLSQIWQDEIMLGRDRYLPFFGWAEKSLQMLEDLLHSEPFKSTGSLGGNRPCGLVWNLDTWPLLVWTAAVSPAGWCRFHCSVTQVRVWVCRVVFGPFHLWPVGYVDLQGKKKWCGIRFKWVHVLACTLQDSQRMLSYNCNFLSIGDSKIERILKSD